MGLDAHGLDNFGRAGRRGDLDNIAFHRNGYGGGEKHVGVAPAVRRADQFHFSHQARLRPRRQLHRKPCALECGGECRHTLVALKHYRLCSRTILVSNQIESLTIDFGGFDELVNLDFLIEFRAETAGVLAAFQRRGGDSFAREFQVALGNPLAQVHVGVRRA